MILARALHDISALELQPVLISCKALGAVLDPLLFTLKVSPMISTHTPHLCLCIKHIFQNKNVAHT
jgi:hypothetical protein